ncbi:unnamed protein product [Brugia timori]|uniref:Rhodanese domain-containing protein n=1 Tax=Brugia timori TaxID=42155 RepID=A0A0R3QEI5_9BILA|nr:unnamed protein product [Brugia timori]
MTLWLAPDLQQLVVIDTRIWYEQKPGQQGTGFPDSFLHLVE